MLVRSRWLSRDRLRDSRLAVPEVGWSLVDDVLQVPKGACRVLERILHGADVVPGPGIPRRGLGPLVTAVDVDPLVIGVELIPIPGIPDPIDA